MREIATVLCAVLICRAHIDNNNSLCVFTIVHYVYGEHFHQGILLDIILLIKTVTIDVGMQTVTYER